MNHLSLQLDAMLLPAAFLILGVCLLSRFGTLLDDLARLLDGSRQLIVVLLVRLVHELSRFEMLGGELLQLERELKHRLPVYSAETVQGREAEFIRDSLPVRRIVLLVVALLVLGAAAGWLSH
jgi:hypothetical protein